MCVGVQCGKTCCFAIIFTTEGIFHQAAWERANQAIERWFCRRMWPRAAPDTSGPTPPISKVKHHTFACRQLCWVRYSLPHITVESVEVVQPRCGVSWPIWARRMDFVVCRVSCVVCRVSCVVLSCVVLWCGVLWCGVLWCVVCRVSCVVCHVLCCVVCVVFTSLNACGQMTKSVRDAPHPVRIQNYTTTHAGSHLPTQHVHTALFLLTGSDDEWALTNTGVPSFTSIDTRAQHRSRVTTA